MKKILVTGGSGHLGNELCNYLISKSYQVYSLDKELSSSQIDGRINIQVDLSNVEKLIDSLKLIKDGIDGVINNAAFYDNVPGCHVNFEEESLDAWSSVFRVNLFAPFLIIQTLFKMGRLSKNASIVNIASIYGSVAPNPSLYVDLEMTNPASYGCSKASLIYLTKWLSARIAPIRVNCVSPGGIERGQNPIFKKRYLERTPLKRLAIEQDIVGIVAFLLEDESSYITGQNFNIDGGFSVF